MVMDVAYCTVLRSSQRSARFTTQSIAPWFQSDIQASATLWNGMVRAGDDQGPKLADAVV